jgi:hypothetical protein
MPVYFPLLREGALKIIVDNLDDSNVVTSNRMLPAANRAC